MISISISSISGGICSISRVQLSLRLVRGLFHIQDSSCVVIAAVSLIQIEMNNGCVFVKTTPFSQISTVILIELPCYSFCLKRLPLEGKLSRSD